jgi:hypothetical protein
VSKFGGSNYIRLGFNHALQSYFPIFGVYTNHRPFQLAIILEFILDFLSDGLVVVRINISSPHYIDEGQHKKKRNHDQNGFFPYFASHTVPPFTLSNGIYRLSLDALPYSLALTLLDPFIGFKKGNYKVDDRKVKSSIK